MEDSDLMPFGKYKGKEMEDVPAQYLLWLYSEGCDNEYVIDYVEENLDVLRKELREFEELKESKRLP